MTTPAELLVTEIRAKLDGQTATLESARTRAATALSASGVIAGLFAQHLKGSIGNWGLAALAAFALGALLALWILWPRKMTLSPDGKDWIKSVEGNDRSMERQAKKGRRADKTAT